MVTALPSFEMHTPSNRTIWSLCCAMVMLTQSPLAKADSVMLLNGLQANSVQTFSAGAATAFALSNIKITPKGNATQPEIGQLKVPIMIMPITSTTYAKSKYVGLPTAAVAGEAKGSALEFERDNLLGRTYGLTLANFRTDYHARTVSADVTVRGEATVGQVPIYRFEVQRAMAQEPDANGLMLGFNERLGELKLTPEAADLFIRGLNLLPITRKLLLNLDYGTLYQSVILLPRLPAAINKPYVAQ